MLIDDVINAAYAGGALSSDNSLRAIGWYTWGWVVGLGMLGGATSFYQKLISGATRPFNFAELLGELVGSAFVGIVTFLLCKEYGFSEYVTAALVGITGHMGSRAMMLFEKLLERKFTV